MILVWLSSGCGGDHPIRAMNSSSLTVTDVLDRCVAAHRRIHTIRAVGLLRDNRDLVHKVLPIRWDYARPDRSRLQIGMDLALVRGADWWTYDSAMDRYKSHRQITNTPIETSAYFLTDGIPLPLVTLMTKGKVAFEMDGRRHHEPWKLREVAWKGGRPCYVLARIGRGPDRGQRWTFWIDQDDYLLRGWIWETGHAKGPPETIWGCTYSEIAVNESMPSDRFQVHKPKPIESP